MNSIYIEGNDKIFIEQYLTHLFGEVWKRKVKVVSTGGWTRNNQFDIELIKTTDNGYKNFLIFDADFITNNGGFVSRFAEIEKRKVELGVQLEFFLFPNNTDDGDFEVLLENIINPVHRALLDCFTQYENCISQYKNSENQNIYQLPIRKAKMYSYVDAFAKSKTQNEAFKRGDYSFHNSDYWDLESSYLEPLKQYLKTIVT